MAKHNSVKENKPKQKYEVYSSLVNYYLALMFSFFTFFLTQKFTRSRHDKYYLFLILTGVLVISAGAAYLISRHEDKLKGTLRPFIKPVTVTDIAFMSFFVCAVISSVFSPYFSETVSAEKGRNNGLILLLAYTLAYIFITRLTEYKDYVLVVYLIFSCVTAALTVINFFYLDPLQLFKGYSDRVVEDFGATIGNKNLIASYMSLFVPAAVMTFVVSDKRWMRVIAGISAVFAYAGALGSNSGSAILGLVIAVPVMAAVSARRYEWLTRFMLAMALMFSGAKALRLFSFIMDGNSKGFEFVQRFLIYSGQTYIPIAVFALLYLLMLPVKKRGGSYNGRLTATVIMSVTIAAVAGLIGAMIYFSVIDTKADLGSFDRLLRFDDKWGTHRGYMWIRSLREYGNFDFFKKLFGSGPDTLYFVFEPYFSELSERFGDSSTNCAHNEYINYLVTQGALGLLSYLTVLISVCVRAYRRIEKEPAAMIFMCAVVGYAVQAVVNIYQPITTPVFIIFIALTEAFNRKTEITE